MPLYSASQLIGRTVTMDKAVNFYRAFDINNLGDKAVKAGTISKGAQIKIDSFLLPSAAYVSSYNIHYAARKFTYFTYFVGSEYYAFRLEDNSINTKILAAGGALTVAQEIEAARIENMSSWEKFLEGLNIKGTAQKFVNVILLLLFVWGVVRFIIPAYKRLKK